MEKKFTTRQLIGYSALVAAVTAIILAVLFYNWNYINSKSVISFDSKTVSNENSKKFNNV